MTLGERIQRLRKSKGLSQEQFAQILQVSRQTVSKWESDINHPELEKLKEISAYFQISMDELLGLELTKRKQEENPINIDQAITRKKFYRIIIAVMSVVLMIMTVSYHRLSTRLDNLQNSLQLLQAQGGHTVYVDAQPQYGFLENVAITYEDIHVDENKVTQVIAFSLRSQKEDAKLWGEYQVNGRMEKLDATATASMSYELRKTLNLEDTISLKIFYKDADGIQSDTVPFEKSLKAYVIGSLDFAYDTDRKVDYNTETTMEGQLLKVTLQDTLVASFPNTEYPFVVENIYVEILNHKETLEKKPFDWLESKGDTTELYTSISMNWERLLQDGDELILRVCVEDENGIKLTSPEILHLSYTKEKGVIPVV